MFVASLRSIFLQEIFLAMFQRGRLFFQSKPVASFPKLGISPPAHTKKAVSRTKQVSLQNAQRLRLQTQTPPTLPTA
jgi:hypothetical protein